MPTNLDYQGISSAAIQPFTIPPVPKLSNAADQAALQRWATSMSVGLARALQALKLDRSGAPSNAGATSVSPVLTFTGAEYLQKGYVEVFAQSNIPQFQVTPFTLAVCIRTKGTNGQPDPLRPDRAFTLQHPSAGGDDQVRVHLVVAPLPLEEFQMAFFTRVTATF